MKRCPSCQQTYSDETVRFCRSDGAILESLDNVPAEILTKRFDPAALSATGIQTATLRESSKLTQGARTTEDLKPETRYAKSGDINIAYQVLGSGPMDLIYVPGWVTHLEYGWEEPSLARFYRKLASFSRLILFDKRGTGLSDQSTNLPTLEQRMDDVRAVMQAVGSECAVVFGMSEGGNMAMLFAATYPERTIALITFGAFATRVYNPDYPWALFIYGEKGTLKASTMRADFIPLGNSAKPIHFDCVFEREKYPEDLTENDIELNAAPATRGHMIDFLTAIDQRSRPVALSCMRIVPSCTSPARLNVTSSRSMP